MLQVIKRCACKSICPLRAIAVHPRSDVLFTFQSSRCFVRLCVCVYDSKIVLFKAYCTPMYGCQLWSSSFQYSLNKLNVAYNDGFRLLLNDPRCCSPSSLFVHHNVPTFDALIRKLIYALWRSCHNSSNVLVDKLFASDIYFESKLFTRWRQLLY